MLCDARIKPAGVDVVVYKVRRLDHFNRIVHNGADLAADLDLFKRDHHRPDGRLPRVALSEQVPELHAAHFRVQLRGHMESLLLESLQCCVKSTDWHCALHEAVL